MSKHRKAAAIFLASLVSGLLASAAFAGAASALPSWHFGGSPLSGTETIAATAVESRFTIPGLTTTCEPLVLEFKVENAAGTGKGTVTGVSPNNCHTDSAACSVASIQAAGLSWPMRLTTVAGAHYLIIENFRIVVFYSGEECVLSELEIPITGSAGGVVNDLFETVTFSSSTFKATGTELKALGSKIEWSGVFHLAATGANSGLAVTVL